MIALFYFSLLPFGLVYYKFVRTLQINIVVLPY